MDAVEYHRFVSLEESLEQVIIRLFVGAQVSDMFEGPLKSWGHFIEEDISMLDLQ